MLEAWGTAVRTVWGKTDRESGEWLPLVQHLEDAAAVAGYLWDTWLPGIVKGRLAAAVGSEGAARTLLVWLAGVHDVSKATPAFAQQAREVGMGNLVDAMTRAGLASPTLGRKERWHHTVTGHVAVQDWLLQVGLPADLARALASVVGAHHGSAPHSGEISSARDSRAMGDEAWRAIRVEILDVMAERCQVRPVLGDLVGRNLSLPALIDLSAVVIVADWLSSDSSNFPYTNLGSGASRLARGRGRIDLRGPWAPAEVQGAAGLFDARFPGLDGATPSALQHAAVDAARTSDGIPLIVVEAPTGSGKSEAALMAAETLAARFGAGGVFVGLPTMATSNAMFSRVLDWVDSWAGDEDPSLWLAHGKAQLNDDFEALRRKPRIRGVFDDFSDAGHVRVSSWLSGRKKGLLANVVVGTIDQVLMGALQARHLALRHLGLSGKVVVVDEVHAADSYMRSFLVRMLEYLGSYGTPVVLLSATLAPSHRAELVDAYRAGRQRATSSRVSGLLMRPRRGAPRAAEPDQPVPGPDEYPLVTVVAATTTFRAVEDESPRKPVLLEAVDDDLTLLVDRLGTVLADGGCVAVVRNTVSRAQETYDALKAGLEQAEVQLFHSRFLANERAERERHLSQVLGPRGDRPHRLVVVGTQVLEQSLDIDVDLMVTDLAPVDLMVQRIGRLHRHRRGDRPAGLVTARCLVTGVDWSMPVPEPVKASAAVYSPAQLLRSLIVLRPSLDGEMLSLPDRGPHLVHAAYDPGLRAPDGWENTLSVADDKHRETETDARRRAEPFRIGEPDRLASLVDWARAPVDDSQEEVGRAQVRDSEDGIEVVALRRDSSGVLFTMPGRFPLSDQRLPDDLRDDHRFGRHLASCTVSLPRSLAGPWAWDRTVAVLENFPEADVWQGSCWLKGQLPLVLDDQLRAEVNGHVVTYSQERGLEARKLSHETEGAS